MFIAQMMCACLRHEESIRKFPKLAENLVSLNNTREVNRLLKTTLSADSKIQVCPDRAQSIYKSCIQMFNNLKNTQSYVSVESSKTEYVELELAAAIGEVDRFSFRK